MPEDEMVGWLHRFNGHEFEQALEEGEGQGSLVCCCSIVRKEMDTTERLNNNNILRPSLLQESKVSPKKRKHFTTSLKLYSISRNPLLK